MSQHSVSRRGFVQAELKQALEVQQQIPPGKIYVIPVRLDDIVSQEPSLQDLHHIDLFPSYDEGLVPKQA